MLDRATEDEPEPEYFTLLTAAFAALNDDTIPVDLIRFWFQSQLVAIAGHSPNLETDAGGNRLVAEQVYSFDFDSVSFAENPNGKFTANHIKFLRLAFSGHPPKTLQLIAGSSSLLKTVMPLSQTMLTSYIRI